MAFPNDGIKFKAGESGNPNGRPKDVEKVLKEYFLSEHNIKLSNSQSRDIIQVLLCKTKKELIDLANNEELPFWVSLIAKKAQRDYEKGSLHILEVLFDRVYGKPKEQTEHSGGQTIKVIYERNTNPITGAASESAEDNTGG